MHMPGFSAPGLPHRICSVAYRILAAFNLPK